MPGLKETSSWAPIKLSKFFDEAVEIIKAAEVPDAKEITQYVKCKHFFLLLRSLRPVILSCLLRSLRQVRSQNPLGYSNQQAGV